MGDRRVNAGYTIVCAVPVGSKEVVLGRHETAPDQFVTWDCIDGTDYMWGHYTDSLLKATKDLCERVMEEVAYLERKEQCAARRSGKGEGQAEVAEAGGRQRKTDTRKER